MNAGGCAKRSLVALIAFTIAASAAAESTPVAVGGARIAAHIASLRELRDAGVVRQQRDYSCGAAALATLLTFGVGDTVDEEALLRALLETLSAEQLSALHKDGLSLRELQQLAQARGHWAQGFRLAADQLPRLSRPVIVFIRPGGYRHFAVLKGVRGDRVHLADPSLGNVRMPLYRFLEQWVDDSGRGVIFALEPRSGAWPERYALEIAEGTPPELRSARELIDRVRLVSPTDFNR